MTSYDNAGVLPGLVPIRALTFVEWDLHLIVPPSDILRRPGNSLPRTHVELIRFLHKRIIRVSHNFPVPSDSALGMWAFNCHEESLHGENIADVEFDQWDGWIAVHPDALLFQRPIIP